MHVKNLVWGCFWLPGLSRGVGLFGKDNPQLTMFPDPQYIACTLPLQTYQEPMLALLNSTCMVDCVQNSFVSKEVRT